MNARHESSPSERSVLVTPSQVIALGLVAASIGWAAWLLRDRPANEEVELLAGTTLPSSEMAIMEAAFDRAQLTGHRTEGGRVWVPRGRQSAYMRALVDAEALPREFGGSLRRALEKNSPWQSRAVQDELLRVATQEELALVICSMPGIERAAVLYDAEPQAGLHGGCPTKTASVNVRTQPDMELDAARVQAIRVLVSASIAGLTPERVAVTDLRSGRVYVGPRDDTAEREAAAIAAADPALARQMVHETHLTQKVRQALSFVKGATVDVSVDFSVEPPRAAAEPPLPPAEGLVGDPAAEAAGAGARQQVAGANTPAELPARPLGVVAAPLPAGPAVPPLRAGNSDLPEAIRVLIAVPDAYFQAASRAAEQAGRPPVPPADIEAREVERIRRHVAALLPATRDPSRREVLVTSFPMASHATGRREAAAQGSAPVAAVGPPSAAAMEQAAAPPALRPRLDPGAVVALVMAGELEEVPRTVWMAATSVCVGLLAAVLWLSGGNRRAPLDTRRGRSQPRIDWSALGPDEEHDGGAAAGLRRAAAVLLAVACCGPAAGPSASAGDAAPAVAPAPDFDREPFASNVGLVAPEPLGLGFRDAAPRPVSPQAFATPAADSHPSAPHVLPAVPLDIPTGSASTPAATPRPGQLTDWKLLAVIAAAFVVVAAATVVTRRRPVGLPPDVFEVLGEASLGGAHAVRIVRFGPKTLLVGVSTAGCQTLAELSDPQATACIAAACRGIQQPIRPTPPVRPVPRPPAAAPAGAEAA